MKKQMSSPQSDKLLQSLQLLLGVCALGQDTTFPVLSFHICKMGVITSVSQNCGDNYKGPIHCLKFSWNPVNTGLS